MWMGLQWLTRRLFGRKLRCASFAPHSLIVSAQILESSKGATRRPRPLRGEWHAEIRVVGGIS
jgi:hypothetical protein